LRFCLFFSPCNNYYQDGKASPLDRRFVFDSFANERKKKGNHLIYFLMRASKACFLAEGVYFFVFVSQILNE